MRIVRDDMGPTIEGYSQSTTETLLENHSYWVFEALGDAHVVSPEIVAPFFTSMPVDEDLNQFIALAYAKVCIGMVCAPLMDYLKRGGKYQDLDRLALAETARPLIEIYARSDGGYGPFLNQPGRGFLAFLSRFCKDRGPFGAASTATRQTGVHLCCHAAILRNDCDFFRQFVELVLLRLFDCTAQIVGTNEEPRVIAMRGLLASGINDCAARFNRRARRKDRPA
jgi:hypothetical protein